MDRILNTMKEASMSFSTHRLGSDRPRDAKAVGSVNPATNGNKVVEESIPDETGLMNWKIVNSIFPSKLPRTEPNGVMGEDQHPHDERSVS